jgi:hypothetical protein
MIDLNFNKLHKLEFADYAKGVIRIVGKYDLEALKIEGIANQLLAKQAEVEELIVAYGKHPLTEKIVARRNNRDKIVSAIVDHLSSVQTASIDSTKMQLDLVSPFVHRHFDNLKKANQKESAERIHQFLSGISADTALNEALTVLGFGVYVGELKTIQDEMDQLLEDRVTSLSERPRMRTLEIKRSVRKAIDNLFNRIELAMLENPAIDYRPLMNELTEWILPYQSLAKARVTRLSNNAVALKLKENEIQKKEAVAMSAKTSATA